jgi:D-hydroxyproline dehydrogenase
MASPKTYPKSACVIGGGIVGLNVALALQGRGLAVMIIDPDANPLAASWGNAGHIATEQVEPLAAWAMVRSLPSRLFGLGGAASFPLGSVGGWLPFGLRLLSAARPSRFASSKLALTALQAEALPAWKRLVAALEVPSLLREDGHLIVWESDATAKKGRNAWSRADTGTASWRDLTKQEAAILSMRLKRAPADAIRFEGSASVSDPLELRNALRRNFIAKGGTIETGLANLDAKTLGHADITIVCAGAASRALMKTLGHQAPIIAERGYHLQTPNNNWGAGLPPIVFEDRSLVVTQFNAALRATSFVEFSKAGSPADPRKWARLHKHTQALGLPFGTESSQWMGARPTLPDYLPAIGQSDRVPGLFYAFGHQHLGLTLAPITGELVAALATGDQPAINLAPFSLARFEGRRS